ncbi:MAG: translesion error-prone DNA polymerase V autoproteolytic subunit [Paludibacteraceae bacterium]|nr:translesion error-prone DNA polymerase V autoproteolytic subunit [Paludibacteraceae bacterium]
MKITTISDTDLQSLELDLADAVHAGFPSPAADYSGERIDIVREMNQHPETTFYARVSGESMVDAGIFDGDILVVDRSLFPKDGDFVIAAIDGEFMLKEYRLDEKGNGAWLIPHNSQYKPLHISADDEFAVWGVVTYNIHKVCMH